MLNRQMINQYAKFIKTAGYKSSKDNLGYYYDNGVKKFSIMKHGPMFICYLNEKNPGGDWQLKSKSNTMLEYVDCLSWVLNHIQ